MVSCSKLLGTRTGELLPNDFHVYSSDHVDITRHIRENTEHVRASLGFYLREDAKRQQTSADVKSWEHTDREALGGSTFF